MSGKCPGCGARWTKNDGWDHWACESYGAADQHHASYACISRQLTQAKAKLAEIKGAWQSGIGDIDSPWRVKMAKLVGDEEGLAEAARKDPNATKD